jgi:hypothetical protein
MGSITGVFGSMTAAEQLRRQLIDAGVAPGCITISRPLTEDPIAGEWLGQSYENQPGQGSGAPAERDTNDEAKYNEAVRSGVCVVSVDVEASSDRGSIERAMRDAGARETGHR